MPNQHTDTGAGLLRPGLCSVTHRDLTPAEVVTAAAEAGLECIEWGADVHAPVGDERGAAAVRRLTEDAGLAVASYGSYLRFADDSEQFQAALATATALGAPRIRVWAGNSGSSDTTERQRTEVAGRLRRAAARAGDAGIQLGLEFHGGTLTDVVDSTLALLDEVGHDNLSTYWQPHQGMPDDEAVRTLERVLDRVSTVHVFSWWPMAERLPLSERGELWRRVIGLLTEHGGRHDLLLEFVTGDDPAALRRDARTLRDLIANWYPHSGSNRGPTD